MSESKDFSGRMGMSKMLFLVVGCKEAKAKLLAAR